MEQADIHALLVGKFGAAVTGWRADGPEPCAEIAPARIADVALFLRDDPRLACELADVPVRHRLGRLRRGGQGQERGDPRLRRRRQGAAQRARRRRRLRRGLPPLLAHAPPQVHAADARATGGAAAADRERGLGDRRLARARGVRPASASSSRATPICGASCSRTAGSAIRCARTTRCPTSGTACRSRDDHTASATHSRCCRRPRRQHRPRCRPRPAPRPPAKDERHVHHA